VANTVAVVIVHRNTPELLIRCLELLPQSFNRAFHSVTVVDNASRLDVRRLRSRFAHVRWIFNPVNNGFSAAVNQAIRDISNADLLLLNPDTQPQSLLVTILHDYLNLHPEVGVIGPQVLNFNGKIEPACRRSIPSPGVAFSRLSGLQFLFPTSKILGRYNLTFQTADKIQRVEAVSGSCMLIRHEVRFGHVDSP